MHPNSRAVSRPAYEALDTSGRPYQRLAQIIGELCHSERHAALVDAVPVVSSMLGMAPVTKITYGAPVFEAYGLKRRIAASHEHARLLMTMGCDLSLDLVPRYRDVETAVTI